LFLCVDLIPHANFAHEVWFVFIRPEFAERGHLHEISILAEQWPPDVHTMDQLERIGL